MTTRTIYLISFFILYLASVVAPEKFILNSDAPAIVGSNISFYAHLSNIVRDEYTIAWQENYPNSGTFKDTLTKSNNYTSKWTRNYNKSPGQFSITVVVTYTILFFEFPVVTTIFSYNVTDKFPGHLEVTQEGVHREDPSFISVLNETLLRADVHDKSGYLNRALNVTYVWDANNTVIANTTTPLLKHNFTKEGSFRVGVNITALFSNGTINGTGVVTKTGYFSRNLTAKTPIVNFTMMGSTWFRHGKLLDLTLTCDGSPPYSYCWTIRPGPYNRTGNETCEFATTNDCEISIRRYFHESGIYTLLLLMENDVGSLVNQTTINVYKVTRKAQMSIIIVPLSCTLLAIVLIIFGVAHYWETQARFTVETANFDFGQSDERPYVSFIDRLRDSLSTSIQVVRQRDGASRNLLIDNDDMRQTSSDEEGED